MYNKEMIDSMKKVAEKRAENAVLEPRRMTADEKDKLHISSGLQGGPVPKAENRTKRR